MLVVFSRYQCRMEDMALEEEVWLRDVEYRNTHGEHIIFRKCEPLGSILIARRGAGLIMTLEYRMTFFKHHRFGHTPLCWRIASHLNG